MAHLFIEAKPYSFGEYVCMEIETYSDPNRIPSRLGEPSSRLFSVVILSSGWPEDLVRLCQGRSTHCYSHDYEVVAVANASKEVADALDELTAHLVIGIILSQHVGYGAGVNAGISRSQGEIVLIVDSSVEIQGDIFLSITSALEDESVGLVGQWGLLTEDFREFEEATDGEVHAMQGCLMAFRRRDASKAGMLDPKYKFYRHADIDFSLRLRDLGFRVRAIELPVTRHANRDWEELPQDQREKKSRENHAKLMRSWRNRRDLLTEPPPASSSSGEPPSRDHPPP